MKLPNPSRAFVADEKLAGYCLNPAHPRGRHKARVFAAVGITEASAPVLKAALLEAAHADASLEELVPHGSLYAIEFDFTTPRTEVRVRSVWMVRKNEDFPRLVSCYIP